MLKKSILLASAIVCLGLLFFLEKEKSSQKQVNETETELLTDVYTNKELEYSIKIPKGFKVESEGKYSVLLMPDVTISGVGPTNFVYISVIDPTMKDSIGEIYNYNPTEFKKLFSLENVGDTTSLSSDGNNDMSQWFTYTLVAVEDLVIGKVKNFQNLKPWEFPSGTTENRFIFETKNNTIIIGYYTGGEGVPEALRVDPRVAYAMIKSFKTDL